MTANSDALFDVLELTSFLTRTRSGATEAELHALSYVACLLAVFDERDAGWWRYSFTTTEVGAPFSTAISDALEACTAAGTVARVNDLVRIGERGERNLQVFRRQRSFAQRLEYVSTACRATLTMPLPMLTEAVTREPQLRSATTLKKAKHLLDVGGLDLLAPHFVGLRAVMSETVGPDSTDLLVPLSVWLTYLSNVA